MNTPLTVAINGMGRIGRNVLRAFLEYRADYPDIRLVAINDIACPDTMLHLLKFDSAHGRLSALGIDAALKRTEDRTLLHLTSAKGSLALVCLQEPNPQHLPWHKMGVDVVLECTGHFRSYDAACLHRTAGAKQVIIGAAPFDTVDASIVMGVNDHHLNKNLPIISGVSCTTQALVPLLWHLENNFGVKSAMLTEIHAVTADQTVLDAAHRDLRRARASGHNIIPTTSSSIAATERVLPNLTGKLAGHSIRVPTITVAAIDVTVILENDISATTLKDSLRHSASTTLKGIMDYTDEPLVSSDFIHNRHSLIIDGEQTMQSQSQHKLFAWYDNEWGYANRLLDMCQKLAES
ncbi:MAG: type I glyceraldehyde-3-phosphate dehydrogenase [Moraxella sp.]|nr:type I glyceraldehyde-3-phosphate dehydrogenase [Moraxella sp.]